MKQFVIKFYALFAIILGMVGYYAWYVKPQISGDIGAIGKIPFGQEYDARMEAPYVDLAMRVRTISEDEPIKDSVVTIGDSFSQFERLGYSNFLANEIGQTVTNVLVHPYFPEKTFVRMVNNHRIPQGTIVIVESVERSCIGRLADLDLSECEAMAKKNIADTDSAKLGLLDETIIWFRARLGMKKPVQMYHTAKDLFTHPTRYNELYIYDSKWDHDGDLRFMEAIRESDVKQAWENLSRLHEFAEANGVTLLYIIAADKYDVYEPFIVEEHVKNSTLDACPNVPWIINTKSILQAKVRVGEQDVYSINNTHWSPKGAEFVGQEVAKRLFLITK